MITPEETKIYSLGECTIDSPLRIPKFIPENARVVVDVEYDRLLESIRNGSQTTFVNAGPRKKIYFDPSKTTAAIVTCGGLCPGLNNVIRGLVIQLYEQYGVHNILGIQYGYEGLNPVFGHPFINLNPEVVNDIEEQGGTILGTSRGQQDISVMVDTLERYRINILFTVGGDGTLRGAQAIFEEVNRRGLKIAVVGVPKTIDNDISYIDRTFGFETAVTKATDVVKGAHSEAKSARNGIGLVKVMGRESGFIAAFAAIASQEANYVLIPEIRFSLHGPHGFLAHLEKRIVEKRHAVIIVAEGAGQEHMPDTGETDASGNKKFGDIGVFLKDTIVKHFKERNIHVNLKYLDPSYYIRSVPASADDAVTCIMLSQNAVHAAMAGKSGIVIGRWNSYFTFLPIPLAVKKRKQVYSEGYLWSIVKESTGQPDFPVEE